MAAIYVTLCPNPGQAEWLEQTRLSVRTAVQQAFGIASKRRATTQAHVMGLAKERLKALPPDLAEGAAKSVATEVTTGQRQGPRESAVLGIRCVKVRANGRLSILTVHGIRIKVPVAPEHERLLTGRDIRGATYLVPSAKGFLLCIPSGNLTGTAAPTTAAQPTRNTEEQVVQSQMKPRPYCKPHGHHQVEQHVLDSGKVIWTCDKCEDSVEVEWR